jgi:hypothetical protein
MILYRDGEREERERERERGEGKEVFVMFVVCFPFPFPFFTLCAGKSGGKIDANIILGFSDS